MTLLIVFGIYLIQFLNYIFHGSQKNSIKIFINFSLLCLLAHRRTKLKLLLILKENPSVETLNAYKQFRNLYNQLIRASKKMYYSEKKPVQNMILNHFGKL